VSQSQVGALLLLLLQLPPPPLLPLEHWEVVLLLELVPSLPLERRDGDAKHFGQTERGTPLTKSLLDLPKAIFGPINQVDLVDGQNDSLQTEPAAYGGMPPGLWQQPFAGIHQEHCHIGVARTSDHVAGVLLVPRTVGDNELAPRGIEVPVGDVDRDALLALGDKAVGQQRQIGLTLAASLGNCGNSSDLIFKDRSRIPQKPANQGALAVIDRSGRYKTSQHMG
jgi:hypothetical protein